MTARNEVDRLRAELRATVEAILAERNQLRSSRDAALETVRNLDCAWGYGDDVRRCGDKPCVVHQRDDARAEVERLTARGGGK